MQWLLQLRHDRLKCNRKEDGAAELWKIFIWPSNGPFEWDMMMMSHGDGG
jgi:hypothetical protein